MLSVEQKHMKRTTGVVFLCKQFSGSCLELVCFVNACQVMISICYSKIITEMSYVLNIYSIVPACLMSWVQRGIFTAVVSSGCELLVTLEMPAGNPAAHIKTRKAGPCFENTPQVNLVPCTVQTLARHLVFAAGSTARLYTRSPVSYSQRPNPC